jgi:hypothetical protein
MMAQNVSTSFPYIKRERGRGVKIVYVEEIFNTHFTNPQRV